MLKKIIVFILSALFVLCNPGQAAHRHHQKVPAKFSGMASFYRPKQHGKMTASGKELKEKQLTAAHKTMPFGTKVKVTNKQNKRSCVVTITDRGPYKAGRVIDLSRRAAKVIGVVRTGTAPVACRVLNVK